MKYIFIAGAPGSKWSSVVKNIYYSPDIDRSDYHSDRTYYHDATGERLLMHLGAYFDPGMEFDLPESFNTFPKADLEALFDRPFSGQGIRIIKSHVFCNDIAFLRRNWPECPVILVHRGDDACLGWWVKCGHFDITYPNYNDYYIDLKNMAQCIKQQNQNLLNAWPRFYGVEAEDNREVCRTIGIDIPPGEYQQVYEPNDIKVKVIYDTSWVSC
jgi:hypothetical protein